MLTHQTVKGMSFLLDEKNSAITIEEALEWAFVNRYSSYSNGELINPY